MGLRRIECISNTTGGRMAVVYRDKEWDEYRVRFWIDAELQVEADYHTSDKGEAQCTARAWAWGPWSE